VDVSEPASISNGIAGRYASAMFDLAKEGKTIKALQGDIGAIDAAMAESKDLRDLLSSPVYTRDQQGAAIAGIAKKMKLSQTTANLLALMADKGRLYVLPAVIRTLREMLAVERGEVTAEVTTAKALTKVQNDKLAKTLTAQVGSKVTIKETVDEAIIGGLIVKVGSKMIDTSIRSKLNALQNTMKEVG
jgi:F-type H+-transporting ATPase subunit delta